MIDNEQVLLRRFAQSRDALAFCELVEGHKNMVFAACRRVLGNRADAEDAAQDCFLKLAEAAGRLKAPISGWLHTVAVRSSIDILRSETARKTRERTVAKSDVQPTDVRWAGVEADVDAALESLSKRLRMPIVLRFLEGRTQEEVAAALGVSRRTVATRLDRGIELLRRRLKRAGVVAPAVALTAMLTASTAEAAPAALTVTLGKMALSGASATKVAAAGGGTLLTLKTAAALVVAAGAGAGALAIHQATRPPRPAPLAAVPAAQVKRVPLTSKAVLDTELTLATGVMGMFELARLVSEQIGVDVACHERMRWSLLPVKVRDVLAAVTASMPLTTEIVADKNRTVLCFWQKEPGEQMLMADMMKLAASDDVLERCTAARWLELLGGRDAMVQLIKMLADPDARVRYFAAGAIVEGWAGTRGDASGAAMCAAPDGTDFVLAQTIRAETWPETRRRMLLVASVLRGSETLPAWEMRARPPRRTREKRLDQLAKGGAEAREAALFLGIACDPDPRVMAMLVDIVAADAKTVRVGGMPGRRVQESVIRALGRIGGPEAEKALIALVKSGADGALRGRAYLALGSRPSREAREVLKAALKDPDHLIRTYAAQGLAQRPNPADVELLLTSARRERLGEAPGLTTKSVWNSVAKVGGERAAAALVAEAVAGDFAAAVALVSSDDTHCVQAVRAALAGDDANLRKLLMAGFRTDAGRRSDAFDRAKVSLSAYYAVSATLAELPGADAKSRAECVQLLGRIRDPRGTDALAKLLVDAEEPATVRRAAAEGLGLSYRVLRTLKGGISGSAMADPAAVESMRHAFEQDTDREVGKLAKKALKAWGIVTGKPPRRPRPPQKPDPKDPARPTVPPYEREFPAPPEP